MSNDKPKTKVDKESPVVMPKKAYFFPRQNKTVKAESLEAATVKLKKVKKETK